MGMGYAGAFVIKVEHKDLWNTELESFKKFIRTLEDKEITLDEFASYIEYEYMDKAMNDTELAYRQFVEDFHNEFGIGIFLGYHDSLNHGDRYDEVTGHYFGLNFGDIYQKTNRAKRLEETLGKNLKISQFVTFG